MRIITKHCCDLQDLQKMINHLRLGCPPVLLSLWIALIIRWSKHIILPSFKITPKSLTLSPNLMGAMHLAPHCCNAATRVVVMFILFVPQTKYGILIPGGFNCHIDRSFVADFLLFSTATTWSGSAITKSSIPRSIWLGLSMASQMQICNEATSFNVRWKYSFISTMHSGIRRCLWTVCCWAGGSFNWNW